MSLPKFAFAFSLLTLVGCTLSANVDVNGPRPSANPSASASASASASPAASASPSAGATPGPVVSASAAVTVAGRFKTKDEYIAFLKCAYDTYANDPERKEKEKASANYVLTGIAILNDYNASRFLTQETFVSQQAGLEAKAKNYDSFCPGK